MISLEEYKGHLMNYCRYSFHDNDIKKKKRNIEFLKKYDDEFLQTVIEDTYDLINEILISDKLNFKYFCFDLSDDTTVTHEYINIVDGWPADILYTDQKSRVISDYILKRTFGNKLKISIIEEEVPYDNQEDGLIYHYLVYIDGFPDNILEIKDSLLENNKQLIKK